LDLLVDEARLYPIHQRLCHFLDIKDIINLTKTCKSLARLYQELLRTQRNLDKQLGRFLRDPVKFRKRLAQCDGVIPGSFALQFFSRTLWPDSNLNVFVKEDRYGPLVQHLIKDEGYRIIGKSDGPKTHFRFHVKQVSQFQRTCNSTVTEIEIIEVKDQAPSIKLLEGYYMTDLVNFITCNGAYSMFPHATFVEKRTYVTNPMDNHFGTMLTKYANRGIISQRLLASNLDKKMPILYHMNRFIGDKYT